MTKQSRAERRAANIKSMGEALGEVYAELWQEVARLFTKWEEYVELFGTRESRIALMNSAAPDFFGKLQNHAFHDVLDIACLTDRSEIAGRENLSIQTLPALVNNLVLKQRVIDLVAVALEKAAFARDWRNRYLAHRDKDLALGRAKPLEPASRAATREALESLGRVLDEISQHYERSTTAWDSGGHYGGAMSLLLVIDDGVRVEQERRQRWETGNVLPSDYAARDI